jgi:hypothetical protein
MVAGSASALVRQIVALLKRKPPGHAARKFVSNVRHSLAGRSALHRTAPSTPGGSPEQSRRSGCVSSHRGRRAVCAWQPGRARACMRRARPMPGCGMSPSPPISLLVSMMTTRLRHSSDSRRAISRTLVVLPTPGRPCRRAAPQRRMRMCMPPDTHCARRSQNPLHAAYFHAKPLFLYRGCAVSSCAHWTQRQGAVRSLLRCRSWPRAAHPPRRLLLPDLARPGAGRAPAAAASGRPQPGPRRARRCRRPRAPRGMSGR